MSTVSLRVPSKAHRSAAGTWGHTLGRALEVLVGVLAFVLLVVPVVLLPFVTAVPLPVWGLLAAVDVGAIAVWVWKGRTGRLWWSVLGTALAGALFAVLASQVFAATPPIVDGEGRPVAGSIAALEKVNLNGSEQWITIRGQDTTKPVLIYLGIGGPGAGGMPASAMMFGPLEKEFVVVNWDQPGTGKSYEAVPIQSLTVQRFVDDAHELVMQMRARFHQDKVYVFGLSWGTILGTKLIQQYPDLFYAYVGNGQMVNTTENDRSGYALAVRLMEEKGETGTLNTLIRNGPPPYSGPGMADKYRVYNNVLFAYMGSPSLEQVMVLVPMFAREYGFADKVNFARGLLDGYPVVYEQLRDLDFIQQAAKLDVPVYFLAGKNDVNAVSSIVERYYNVLEAPHKELIWSEEGHGASTEEIAATIKHVLEVSPPSK